MHQLLPDRSGQDRKRFYGYVIAATCFTMQAVGIGSYISFGVFVKPLIADFGWTRAAISGAQSLALFLSSLVGMLVGRLNDRIGPRWLVAIAGGFLGLGYFLMSGLEEIWQLYIFYGAIVGIGLSSIDVISLSTTARWFRKRRGAMTGIVKVGTGFGQVVLPSAAAFIIASYGWSTAAYPFLSILTLSFMLAFSQLLRRDPAQMGQLPDGAQVSATKTDVPEGGLFLHDAVRTSQFWMICAANLFSLFCLTSMMLHIAPHAEDIGIAPTLAASVLSAIGFISMGGRFLTGMAIDKIGSRRTMIACLVILILSFLWLQLANELWMLYLFAALYGVAHGGIFTVFSPIIAEYFGIRTHGTLFGISMFVGLGGGSLGAIAVGHIFDVTGTYSPAFWLLTVLAGLSLLSITLLRPIKKDWA
jgi:MFS family permease